MDRTQLFSALSNLPTQDFERLLFAVKPPGGLVPSPEAPQINRVKALLDWAEGSSGQGIDKVQDCFDKLQNGTLPAAFDFSGYLQFVCEDPRCQSARDLYTETEVLIPLEAETVEKKSPTADSNREAEAPQQKVERFPVLEGLRKYALGEQRQHLLLAGRPGSGKSTTLKRLLLETTGSAMENPVVIPVYVQLKGDRPIIDLVIAEFRRAKVRVTSELINEWLFNDQLLLLLDGVNEIPSDEQRRKLQEFREDNPTAPMIFTTRDLAAGGDLGIEKRLEMRPLSETQMREFVQNYLPDHAETLLRQLKDRLREVAETPLLLKMLCDVFDPATEQIPQSKGELFRLFDSKYDKFKGLVAVSEDFRRFKPELLQNLAFSMLQGDPAKPTEPWLTLDRNRAERILETYLTDRVEAPGQRAKEWLEDLLEHHLLQVASDPKEIEFHHQLFQEYYAAEALLLKLSELLEDEAKFKHDYLNLLKWTEAISLMLALVDDDEQALRVVKLAMNDVDLMLGSRLAGAVSPTLQPTTVGWIHGIETPIVLKVWCWAKSYSESAIPILLAVLEDPVPDVRWSTVKALGQIGSEAVIPGLLKALEDPNLDVRWSAAEALGRIGNEMAIPRLLKALEHPVSYDRESAAEALGKIGSETAIPSLLTALEDSVPKVRILAAKALEQIGSETAILGLLKALSNPVSNVQKSAAKALERIGHDVAIPGLLKALENSDPNVRSSAASALGKIGREVAVPKLLQALEDPIFNVCWSAAEALGRIGSETAIPGLLKAFEHPKPKVRGSAASALGEIGSEVAIPGLLTALEYRFSDVRFTAAEALGLIGSEMAIPGLLKVFKHPDPEVCWSAAEALGRIGSEMAIPGLLKVFEYSSLEVRWSVVEALGEIGSEVAIPGLLKALEDDDLDTRKNAAEALGKIGSKAAIPGLLKALKDPVFGVRKSVTNALNKIDQKTAIPIILKAVEEQAPDVRWRTANVLEKIDSEVSISGLLTALEQPDSDVRWNAANMLGEVGSKAAIPGLLKALEDPVSYVRESVAEALGKIGSKVAIADLWQLHLRRPEDYLEEAISAIQDRCKFYNYEICQAYLAAQHGEKIPSQSNKTIANTITIQTVEKLTIMSDKAPIFNQQHATIGVNYAAEGSQQDFTQYIHAPEQSFENLLTGYKHFIDELQQQNPHLTSETAIIQTIDIEARRIDTRWQNFLNLQRLWNGGKKAAIKVGEHFVESNPWGKGAIAFLEGVSEDVK